MHRVAKHRILPLAPFVALLIAVNANAESIILDCRILEGGPKKDHPIQIMIDEEGKLLVYNYQLGSDFRRQVGPNQFIDLSMKITAGNDKFILANDGSGALVITKDDGKFVHSYVTAVPLPNGKFAAVGNTHAGECTRNPFK